MNQQPKLNYFNWLIVKKNIIYIYKVYFLA